MELPVYCELLTAVERVAAFDMAIQGVFRYDSLLKSSQIMYPE